MSKIETLDDWECDSEFLEQIIQVEELALSRTQNPNPQPPPPPPQAPSFYGPPTDAVYLSYSPPRELSQRPGKKCRANSGSIADLAPVPISFNRSGSENEEEIVILKNELGRVSKQLSHLEKECLDLRKERDKKEEQLKSVFSKVDSQEAAGVSSLKSAHTDVRVLQEQPEIPLKSHKLNYSNGQTCSRLDTAPKCIEAQTEKSGASSKSTGNHNVFPHHDLSNKLLAIWSSQSRQRSGRDLVSKLFVTCSSDFQVLFSYLNVTVDSETTTKNLENKSINEFPVKGNGQPVHSSEISKLSHLYAVMTKVSSGMAQLEALFEALLDVCNVENVVIVYRSLHILHGVLDHLLSLENSSERRDNIMLDGLCYGNIKSGRSLEMGVFDPEILHENKIINLETTMSLSCIDWGSLFQLMHQIASRNTSECVKYEAASIMSVVFLKSNAYLDKEKFDETLVFESVSQLLKKEWGLRVQKKAVQLLYLTLNCPPLLVTFCSGCKGAESADAASSDAIVTLAYRKFSSILQGLADCVANCENSPQDIKLRRNAIIVLAFLASSGNAGFEILLSEKISKRTDFLVLILQLVVSEMNIEARDTIELPGSFEERTMLIREALIFLNRLVSNPANSSNVLKVLTKSREGASLTVEIANRLSRKGLATRQYDSMFKQMRESEIVDLARAFKKRVFAYLGDKL